MAGAALRSAVPSRVAALPGVRCALIDGEDLGGCRSGAQAPAARIMPRIESRLIYLSHSRAAVRACSSSACERDLEGIVAKWANGTYQCDGRRTSWLKVKNSDYSQAQGRHDVPDDERSQI